MNILMELEDYKKPWNFFKLNPALYKKAKNVTERLSVFIKIFHNVDFLIEFT